MLISLKILPFHRNPMLREFTNLHSSWMTETLLVSMCAFMCSNVLFFPLLKSVAFFTMQDVMQTDVVLQRLKERRKSAAMMFLQVLND
jgi:fumarate reductase subunit C